jgi:hypothetical protein
MPAHASALARDASRREVLPALPRAIKDYAASFNIVAVCAYRDGRIGVSRDPVGATAAWWVEAELAGGLIRQVRQNGGDIPTTAQKLGVLLTDHSTVLTRASAATSRIENALSQAQARGDLKFFNAAYKRRRAEAKRAGKSFMSYAQARERLARAIASTAAEGGTVKAKLIAGVFG